ncbi:MAG: 2Fe-2S iron-sulfur cluster-binding protein, partial [Myxococcota bacterium]|nr:2Fe-2S iron-sulfur cluster-binding protein [Myxococcota bacterium]
MTLTYEGDHRVVELMPDKTLLEHSLEHGIDHAHVCRGNARCSTCRVEILDGLEHLGPRNEREAKLAEK